MPRWIERTEVQKQRREQNQSGVVEKSDRQIQVAVTTDRRVEQKHKRGQTERRKMKRVRRTSTLFEEHKEPDKQVDQADEIYVELSRCPLVSRAEIIKVGPVRAVRENRRSAA